MSRLTYHLEAENSVQEHDLVIRLETSCKILSQESLLSLATTSRETSALECLLKEQKRKGKKIDFCHFTIAASRSFDVLKWLGATGKLFFKGKKVAVDPFTNFAFYFVAERQEGGVLIAGHWKMGHQSGELQECTWVFPATPSWALHEGIIRTFKDEFASQWIRFAMAGPKFFNFAEWTLFLRQIEGEVPLVWKTDQAEIEIEPLPFLELVDRHGGFANLWFDYGPYGKIAAHDSQMTSWRKQEVEKGWERDLLETDFILKKVEHSHYYCPLDKVAKSLTFLLEVGWTILDVKGRKVLRQKTVELDAEINDKMVIRAKVQYDQHQVDLKDLVGAFNRRETFVDLSSESVALLDREQFSAEWEDFIDEEVTSAGISLKKNHLGVLFEKQEMILREDLKQQIERMAKGIPSSPIEPGEQFKGTLFPYQKEGLQWLKFLEEGKFGGLLADDMGLGKTVQVLAFFSQCKHNAPSLIVVPTSLMFNWQREMEKFFPLLRVYRHEGSHRCRTKELMEQHHVILTSYALLRLDAEIFQQIHYHWIVLDEAQTIKNPESQIAQICFRLNSQMRLAMTGTPIENRAQDLWSIFHFLLPDLLGDRLKFQGDMLSAQADRRYLERVRRKIKPFILRRKKEQVAWQLPPKLEQTVFVEMTEPQRQIYERWLQKTKQGLLKKVSLEGASVHRMEILEAILRLRQLCVHPWLVEGCDESDPFLLSAKFERLIADIQEVVEEQRKVLVYSQFTQMLRLIEQTVRKRDWKYVYLDGRSSYREEAVQQFQQDPDTAIFLMSLKAGGVGLNLTAADYVFLYDPWWNEAVERQAIDRAHRIGKTGLVIARRYMITLSIEEKIHRLKMHKTALSQSLLESGMDSAEVSLEDLLELLE